MADTYSFFNELFMNIDVCYKQDVSKCKSLKRIKIVLKECDDIIRKQRENNLSESQLASQIHNIVHNKLGNGNYSNIKLLNDFDHLKYGHKVDSNHNEFNKTFNKLTNTSCNNIETCPHFKRHFNPFGLFQKTGVSRTEKMKQNVQRHDGYCISVIARIHTYFLHSCDMKHIKPNKSHIAVIHILLIVGFY